MEAEAARAGLTLAHWVEETVSGANHDRAAENTYYALARQHSGLNFIFSHPNRVGRHVEVTVGIARQIHRLGGTVWIAGLGNLRDPRNWRHFLRDAADAENEYTNLVSQMALGKRAKAAENRWPHGTPPWGYTLERDHRGRSVRPVIDPAVAPTVRRLYDLAEQYGQTRVAALMREEGWPAQTPAGWTAGSVQNLLTNARYTGRALFGGLTLHYEALISPEQFQRVQERRAARRKQNGPRSAALLWSGHVYCADCGAALGRLAVQRASGHHTYYRCWRSPPSAALRSGRPACLHRILYPAARVEAEWWSLLREVLTTPELLAAMVAPSPLPPAGPPPARVQELEAAIARAWAPFAAGKVGEAVAESLAAPYVQGLAALRAEYAAPLPAAPDYDELARSLGEGLMGAVSPEDQRELLEVLDVRLYLGRDTPPRFTLSLPE